jgi:calcineurin-like phosphoesterase family protein
MCFPLIRWKMFETYLEDVDEAVEQIRNNRYSSVIEHLGGNVYLTVDNNDKTDCWLLLAYYLLFTEFVQYVINRGFIHQQHVIFG